MTGLAQALVALQQVASAYPQQAPFHPAESYPEYRYAGAGLSPSNAAYAGVREVLHLLDLDGDHYGSPAWNPLGALVAPGDTVLIKPNLIREAHGRHDREWIQVITHGAVVRAVLDYVALALRGQGRVIVADGPQTDSDFERICQRSGLREVVAWQRQQGLDVVLLDLRRDRWFQRGDVIYKRVALPGDPAGYTTVDLGTSSEFATYGLNGHLYGADYDTAETASFHTGGRHAYVLCRSVMDADVVINLPKLKTHKKTGVTLSLKNMVGINGYRNCLPHHTIGTPDRGGDEFAAAGVSRRLQSGAIVNFKRTLVALGGTGGVWARVLKRTGRAVFGDTNQVIRSGNWHGNDTAWRMVLDLNKALFYYDGSGHPRQRPLRYLSIVDGIIGGDGNGPISPDARPVGLVVAGINPVAVDTACTIVMGFDYQKIPLVAQAWQSRACPLVDFAAADVVCRSNVPQWNGPLAALEAATHLAFKPHFGWQPVVR